MEAASSIFFADSLFNLGVFSLGAFGEKPDPAAPPPTATAAAGFFLIKLYIALRALGPYLVKNNAGAFTSAIRPRA